MSDLRIKRYRKRIEKLETENEELTNELNELNESGFTDLARKTKKTIEKYNQLIKEALHFRNEYERLVKEQERMMMNYKKDMNMV